MKKLLVLLLIIVIMGSLVACVEPTAESKQTAETQKALNEINNQIGMPNITEYYEKKLMKEIYELRDNSKLVCYYYTKNDLTGKYIYEGKCIGYGLPYATQYTNPMQYTSVSTKGVGGDGIHWNYELMPQADPNGLYMPSSAAATWIIRLDEKTGAKYIDYCESDVTVSQGKKDRRLCEEWSLPENY